ncbi:MAG: DUF6261 family protein, partial [Odoribacteraceae bacterium]|nr:DUF6261 family protein [Odoribacteraceae bacterium]
MRRIKSACLQFFRNAAHCGFMTMFHDLLEEFPRAREVAGALFGEFVALLAREEALYSVTRASWYTGRIVEANKQVDCVLVGMRGMIEAALHHHDPAIARAARRLHDRFAAFGYITRKTYMGKVAVIHLLVAD